MMTNYRSMSLCLLLALAFIVGPVSFTVEAQTKNAHTEYSGRAGGAGANFTLTDQDGRPFQLSGLRGRVVLLFFGYTSCPDACPTTLSKLSKVYKLLGADRDRVVTLFVSVDPGRDTPRVLKDYLKYFRVNAVGLTGTKEEIDRVVSLYGARYEIEKSDSATGYHVNHSTDLYLIDQKGEVAQRFKYEGGTKEIADAVRRLIR
jgi:cytochrome oxidase Cu insertion factor (SCO1/SenC/PrrC family)